MQAARQGQVAERAPRPQLPQGLSKARRGRRSPAALRPRGVVTRLGQAARRLADGEGHHQGDQYARQADDHEGAAPAEGFRGPAARAVGQEVAEIDPHREHAERQRPAPARKNVGDDGMRRRAATGLPHPDAHAQQGQLQEILGRPDQGRQQAPGRQRERHHALAPEALGRVGDRHAQHRVEHRESEPRKQAQLPVHQAQFLANLFLDDDQDLAVDEIERVDQRQQPQDVPAVGRLQVWRPVRFVG